MAGKRCLAYRNLDGINTDCPCLKHSKLFDHPRIWLDIRGQHVFTAEPYFADGEEVAATQAELARLGLRLTVDGRSMWNPGGTLLLVVKADSSPPAY